MVYKMSILLDSGGNLYKEQKPGEWLPGSKTKNFEQLWMYRTGSRRQFVIDTVAGHFGNTLPTRSAKSISKIGNSICSCLVSTVVVRGSSTLRTRSPSTFLST